MSEFLISMAYSCPLYVWKVARNTTRAERLSCAVAVLALVLCTTLVLYFTLVARRGEANVVDRAPHEWNISREDWLARDSPNNITVDRFSPIKLVIVQHTVSPECHRFTNCAAELRNLQRYFLDPSRFGYDLPYNFMIGNDGRVYQGRGWNRQGAHTLGYNRCSLGVAFIGSHIYPNNSSLQREVGGFAFVPHTAGGVVWNHYSNQVLNGIVIPNHEDGHCRNYRDELPIHSRVTDLQLSRFNMLLAEGVKRGFLRPDYSVLGAKDLRDTVSPGDNLYRALQAMEHYERNHSFRNMTCEEIYDKLGIPYD